MKSLLFTGFVAGSLLFMNGCSTDDVVNAIADAAKTNVVYVVNGTGGTITVSAEGEDDKSVASKNLRAEVFILEGHNNYDVSYDGAHQTNFEHGSVYLYAATTCNNSGFIRDQIDVNRVHVVNLTGADFTDNIVIKDLDGVVYTITDDTLQCSVISSDQANGINVGNGMSVKIGSGSETIISGIPPKLEDAAKSVKIDVIIYSSTEVTVVPMANFDDLL